MFLTAKIASGEWDGIIVTHSDRVENSWEGPRVVIGWVGQMLEK
jgi:hypothetical protein